MLERQREGIAKAKGEGKYKGRAPTARAKADGIRRLAVEGETEGVDRGSAWRKRPQRLPRAGAGSVGGLERPGGGPRGPRATRRLPWRPTAEQCRAGRVGFNQRVFLAPRPSALFCPVLAFLRGAFLAATAEGLPTPAGAAAWTAMTVARVKAKLSA